MNVLIVYGTIEGQTGKIARFVEAEVRKAGHTARMLDAEKITAPVSFDDIDRVIIAGSVHERRHPKALEVFLTADNAALKSKPSLFLSVSLSAAFAEGLEEAGEYLLEMEMRTGFTPDDKLLVPGAIKSKSYDYFASQVVRHVVMRGRKFDPNAEEIEFTDWDALAEKVSAFLATEKVTG